MMTEIAEKCADAAIRNVVFGQEGDREALAAHIRSALTAARASDRTELERLRAIVEKLPKTKDGVPITPGMVVFPLHPINSGDAGFKMFLQAYDVEMGEWIDDGWDTDDFSKNYSTVAAAEAAQAALKEPTDE